MQIDGANISLCVKTECMYICSSHIWLFFNKNCYHNKFVSLSSQIYFLKSLTFSNIHGTRQFQKLSMYKLILVQLWQKLQSLLNFSLFCSVTNQYWAMRVKFPSLRKRMATDRVGTYTFGNKIDVPLGHGTPPNLCNESQHFSSSAVQHKCKIQILI